MSRETIEWLNHNTMIGFTTQVEKYANNNWVIPQQDGTLKAWWQQDDYQYAYPGAIPIADVERVLFHWTPVETKVVNRIYVDDPDLATGIDADGNFYRDIMDPDKKGIMRPDTLEVFGYFGSDSYKVHTYKEWLYNNVSMLIDGEVGISSAGLLQGGGVGYVSLQLPDNVTVVGMDIRPTFIAATSMNGTLATTYKNGVLVPVCDNSLDAGLQGTANRLKIKHTAKSLKRIAEARDVLGILYKQAEDMELFLTALSEVDVTDQQFAAIVSGINPVPDAQLSKGKVTNQGAITRAENRQADLWTMYRKDPRAAQWNGTLLGAFQAVNTWNEHERTNNPNAVDRLMTGTLKGTFAKYDDEFWSIVKDVEDIDITPVELALTVIG